MTSRTLQHVESRILETLGDRASFARWLDGFDLPLTVKVSPGKVRSIEQNRLQRLWLNEAAAQLGDETAEEKRGYCKLHFGVPILRAELEGYREQYDRIIRPLPYEQKLALMMMPLDYPVTRLMTTRQCAKYHDAVYQHFAGLGVQLTEPDGRDDV